MASDPIPVEEKRQALERVLASRTFSRSERLRAFLRYVCEAEFEGRAGQINEYALGVTVLGRPPDYSPAEDSSVRSRAYELRNKLRSYYESEASSDPIQIEIDKGAYVPRFLRRERKSAPGEEPRAGAEAAAAVPKPPASESAASAPPPSELAAPLPILSERPATASTSSESAGRVPPRAEPAVPRPRRLGPVLGAGIAILLACALLLFFARGRRDAVHGLRGALATREMEVLWRPFFDSEAPLLIAFETRLFFFAPSAGLIVRDYQTNEPAQADRSGPPRAFRERMGADELQPRFDYADFGAVHAAFLLGRLLDREIGLKHSSSLGWQDIWNSNIIFLGKPNLNPTIRYPLQGRDFVETEGGGGIVNLHPLPGERPLYPNATTHGEGEKYGLITVLPGPQPGRRMMILSSAGAEVTWALAEAVTSPARVHEILSPVLPPSGDAPAAFQVVLSATFESNVPVKIRYVTHRVTATP